VRGKNALDTADMSIAQALAVTTTSGMAFLLFVNIICFYAAPGVTERGGEV